MLLLWLCMLCLGVNLTAVIPCLVVSQLFIFISCNVFTIVCLKSLLTSLSTHTSLVRETLQWLHLEHCSIFKTTLLVYKLLHSGYPKYFVPSLKPRHSVYKTCKSQAGGLFLEVPHFATSVYKSTKHYAWPQLCL